MAFENYFPVWNTLTADQKKRIHSFAVTYNLG